MSDINTIVSHPHTTSLAQAVLQGVRSSPAFKKNTLRPNVRTYMHLHVYNNTVSNTTTKRNHLAKLIAGEAMHAIQRGMYASPERDETWEHLAQAAADLTHHAIHVKVVPIESVPGKKGEARYQRFVFSPHATVAQRGGVGALYMTFDGTTFLNVDQMGGTWTGASRRIHTPTYDSKKLEDGGHHIRHPPPRPTSDELSNASSNSGDFRQTLPGSGGEKEREEDQVETEREREREETEREERPMRRVEATSNDAEELGVALVVSGLLGSLLSVAIRSFQ